MPQYALSGEGVPVSPSCSQTVLVGVTVAAGVDDSVDLATGVMDVSMTQVVEARGGIVVTRLVECELADPVAIEGTCPVVVSSHGSVTAVLLLNGAVGIGILGGLVGE